MWVTHEEGGLRGRRRLRACPTTLAGDGVDGRLVGNRDGDRDGVALLAHQAQVAQAARSFLVGVVDDQALADEASPKEGDRNRDGYQALSGYFGYRHRPLSLKSYRLNRAIRLPKSGAFFSRACCPAGVKRRLHAGRSCTA